MNENINKVEKEIIKELVVLCNPYIRVVISVDGVIIVEDVVIDLLRVSYDTTDTKR
ncbi:hypothetical protein [Listeria monocytogenes]|uniref:hypothetical protein n=1 Tax=Listeria monocytogenes TaxID=1639 RepID=UPI0015F279B5|nr:hypothetical protein [Listeria monocytogenes]EHM3422959.1 hypothetical protein [Listeria monocytogenes]EIE7093692.1 hypothetical protein [Listeria monocytogenes]EIR7650897.1 hypothetical protein [Listeria monocytogenes]EIU5913303.1 hypothetical protein [Listeria monocytogenes]EJN2655092.1 hypothetical protein [Listeria monocytogenes]